MCQESGSSTYIPFIHTDKLTSYEGDRGAHRTHIWKEIPNWIMFVILKESSSVRLVTGINELLIVLKNDFELPLEIGKVC